VLSLVFLGIVASLASASAGWPQTPLSPMARQKTTTPIQHLIFIIQENRSFDHYFGTYPGADGIPSPLPCLPELYQPSQCISPYLNHLDINYGNAHGHSWQAISIDGGKMDGFVVSRQTKLGPQCNTPNSERVRFNYFDDELGEVQGGRCRDDVMGYHDGTDIPNYWSYAQNYVLMDHFFESIASWSEPNHLAIFSGWAATCSQLNPPDVNSCSSSFGGNPWNTKGRPTPDLWTDITYMLYQNGISWGVYLDGGQGPVFTHDGVPGIWSVLPGFQTVQEDGQVANAELNQTQFYADAASGNLPAVTWLLPQYYDSEHPQASILHGQSYVTGLINAVMQGPDWSSSAIFVSWDDIDGFYDHEPPPFQFDKLGLGIRVPAFMVSPYALTGYIDHQVCSTDCYLKLIEDTFLSGERMDQSGRPDPRPDYRDSQPAYGDLLNDFNFNQAPRRPLILSKHPMSLLR